jgi:hypothetical protein
MRRPFVVSSDFDGFTFALLGLLLSKAVDSLPLGKIELADGVFVCSGPPGSVLALRPLNIFFQLTFTSYVLSE